MAVSLDPYAPQEALLHVPMKWLGARPEETYQVHELMSDQRSLWQGPDVQVRLTPEQPAAIWAVYRFRRTEQAFDYYE
jgi:starch synthase (maltosyl-transferring)